MSTVHRPSPPTSSYLPPEPPEPEIIETERSAVREVLRLAAERAGAEARVETARAAADTAADQEYERARRTLDESRDRNRASARTADELRRRSVIDAALAGESEAKTEFAKASRRIAAEFDTLREQARGDYAREKHEAAATFEAAEREAAARHARERKPVDDAARLTAATRDRLAAVFAAYQKFGLDERTPAPTRESYEKIDDPADAIYDRLARREKDLALLEALYIPRAMKGRRWAWLFVLFFLTFAYPLYLLLDGPAGLAVAAVAAVAAGLLARQWLYAVAKTQVSRLYDPILQTVVDAEALAAFARNRAEERHKSRRAEAAGKRDEDLARAKQRNNHALAAGEDARDEKLRKINDVYARKLVDIQTRQQLDMREAIAEHERRSAEVESQAVATGRRLDEKYQGVKQKVRDRYQSSWAEMAARWKDGMTRAAADLDGVARASDALGPPWDDPGWSDRPLPREVPPVVRFGTLRLDLADVPGGVPADARLADGLPTSFTLPALRAFPSRANLVIEAPAAGRAEALGVLQAAMFRLLTSLPPGAVRFTIVDPLGIGRNFGAFMHLADYDEALVTGQVWTEPRQIKERLEELSAHMEKVTQRYLRNEYATIEEYNAVAGEVAEPYRVLVVADFPAGFDDESAARLAAIAAGGVPCGVLTLIALDTDRPLPAGLTPAALRRDALPLAWKDNRLAWGDPDLGRLPLALDPPPPAEFATRLIQKVGAAAKDARRVEVPFEFIAPAPDEWWTRDTRAGIDVPLGKAGATKRQNLTLGHGTSQHVLVAGRTGSGKSTLLHALITNLALNYSPDQVDLYLIDFKKGVEFKVYATYQLPHASVVAIESEREFGISVLQRLDAEMRARADTFRDAGVQDLHGYRNASGSKPMPRVMLIVDEFQEFFVEDDKVAQDAALLLDRLVRQGRAFGIHVILGSQSLGGAYALARSTLGQMAVRVALQCSEGDASLILSEQNSAAKMLSRPGEAVYNDANGLPEGNHFFQVVWLPDERREDYLRRLRDLARERSPAQARTPIVFEGDAPAELARNPILVPLIEAPAWPESPRSARAWLGDAVAIKDPTAALFRRQGASHLLIVGQGEEMALGVVASALVGLAAQYPPPTSDTVRFGAKFAVLDGTPEDHPHAESLAGVAKAIPHPVAVGGWREASRILAELAAELDRRQQPDAPDGPEIYLFVHDLPRFRDLRRKPDDFGFSTRAEDAGPPDHLAALLRDGPGVGLHVIAWCDTLNNLNRVLDHQALREMGMRVLFQMSQTDSGHLIDAPHASRLGPHRALFATEEQNRVEKFRPYGLPSPDWLAHVREAFARRQGDGDSGL